MGKISAIYTITNIVNGNKYVGSAVSFGKRKTEHLCSLRRNTHRNQHLQKAFNKYGESNFTFDIVEQVLNREDLISREQYYIDTLHPEYNICKIAGKMPEDAGKRASEKRRSNGNYVISQETKDKLRLANIGKKHSEETVQKMRGRKLTAEQITHREEVKRLRGTNIPSRESIIKRVETRKKNGNYKPSYSFLGKTHSEETRAKMRESKIRNTLKKYQFF